MLTITFSNRFQDLLDNLLLATATPPESPFSAVEIIVPSAAIQRQLELSMAEHYGICANVRFSYLGQWVWHQIAKIWPVPDVSPFAPETLVWRILKILENPSFVVLHPRLRSWLANADAVMRYELAAEVSSVIDQTMTYRPNLIDAWSTNKLICVPGGTRITGQDQQWQAELWRRILHETGSDHHLSAVLKKLESINEQSVSNLRNNATTHIFCPPTIAPLTIDILNCLAQWMDLRLYVLNPCREYWFDIIDRKRLSYLSADGKADHHETGNHLLSAWGKQTQAMIDLLFENTSLTCNEENLFTSNAEQGKTTLLAQVQDAILELRDISPNSIALDKNDRSIEVHVCHSLTRELEVLQDQLLAMFAQDSPPSPDEVLVITPNLQDAAPLIDAVFGTPSHSRRIPYTITGLGNTRINPIACALIDLLSLASSRFTASAVFKLLQQPIVAQQFGLNNDGLNAIHRWMTESGIRWGLDATHRQQLQLPENDRYTFRDGIHRLFLGYALPSDTKTPFSSRLPAGDIEGSDATALGSFQHFMEQLEIMRRDLNRARSSEEWRTTLLGLLDKFTSPIGNQIDDSRDVRSRIQELCDNMKRGRDEHPIERDIVLCALTRELDDPARGGVPTGTVTFTSMSSLRNLPYRVICAIGMNDSAFPTMKRPPEFDLIAQSPKRGDRQRRLDERNLFLDLLLATQDRLYLSYTGRSVRDNSEIPPSVLISDLLDYLSQAIDSDAGKRLLVKHPLQAFSITYFQKQEDARIASCNSEYFHALKAKLTTAATKIPVKEALEGNEDVEEDELIDESAFPFFRNPLPNPDESWRRITLEQLLQFFRNPARYLLRHRLGMAFPENHEDLEDDEPFLPDWDEKNTLADRLLPMYLDDASADEIRASAMAGTEYPPGAMGNALLERELQAMETFSQKLKSEIAAPCLPSDTETLTFRLGDEEWTLTHTFDDLRANGLIRYRFDDTRPTDYLTGWITHLFLNASQPSSTSGQTVWHSRNGAYLLNPVTDAYAQLLTLLALYRQGLREPLHFYPKSSWAYVSNNMDLNKATTKWHGGRNEEYGEGRDPAYMQALRGKPDPLDAAFENCSRAVFEPLLNCISDPRLEQAS